MSKFRFRNAPIETSVAHLSKADFGRKEASGNDISIDDFGLDDFSVEICNCIPPSLHLICVTNIHSFVVLQEQLGTKSDQGSIHTLATKLKDLQEKSSNLLRRKVYENYIEFIFMSKEIGSN